MKLSLFIQHSVSIGALALILVGCTSSNNSSINHRLETENRKETPSVSLNSIKPYPLDVCIVTDNDLDSMGEPTEIVYEGQVIKFCCKPCEKKFLKNPPKYILKLAPKKA